MPSQEDALISVTGLSEVFPDLLVPSGEWNTFLEWAREMIPRLVETIFLTGVLRDEWIVRPDAGPVDTTVALGPDAAESSDSGNSSFGPRIERPDPLSSFEQPDPPPNPSFTPAVVATRLGADITQPLRRSARLAAQANRGDDDRREERRRHFRQRASRRQRDSGGRRRASRSRDAPRSRDRNRAQGMGDMRARDRERQAGGDTDMPEIRWGHVRQVMPNGDVVSVPRPYIE